MGLGCGAVAALTEVAKPRGLAEIGRRARRSPEEVARSLEEGASCWQKLPGSAVEGKLPWLGGNRKERGVEGCEREKKRNAGEVGDSVNRV